MLHGGSSRGPRSWVMGYLGKLCERKLCCRCDFAGPRSGDTLYPDCGLHCNLLHVSTRMVFQRFLSPPIHSLRGCFLCCAYGAMQNTCGAPEEEPTRRSVVSLGNLPLIFSMFSMWTTVRPLVVNVEFCTWTLLLQEHWQMPLVIVGLRGRSDLLVLVDEAGETLHCILQMQTHRVGRVASTSNKSVIRVASLIPHLSPTI